MKVKNMEWKDMEGMVTRQLNKLAMCKRGTLETAINELHEKNGDCPKMTPAEIRKQRKDNRKAVQKACSVTLEEIKDKENYQIQSMIRERLDQVTKAIGVHPKAKAWQTRHDNINKQKHERMAELNSDFDDVADAFRLGMKPIQEFPAELIKLEQREW